MYLLDTQQLMDLFGRNKDKLIFSWIEMAKPTDAELFVSVVSFGQIAHAIEVMSGGQRSHWRRLFQEGRRRLEELGSVIEIDGAIIDVWQSALRGYHLADIVGAEEEYGEDDRLIIATAIARNYALVTEGDRVLAEISDHTTLTLIEL